MKSTKPSIDMNRIKTTWKYLTYATLLLVVLKLLGLKISWWLVFTPFLIIPLIALLTVIVFFLLLLLTALSVDPERDID